MIDLHSHSTFSDGSLTPEEIVSLACEGGLTAVALTDHDCMDGIERFMAACEQSRADGYRDGQGLVGIPGVEISADVPHGTLHMLGYYVDGSNAELATALGHIRDGREYRNHRILDKLNALGMALTWDEVSSCAGEDVVGRPHFAMAMLAKEYVSSKQKAFDMYLGKGRQAYVDRFRLTPEDSVGKILRAGGVPVLAHPFTLGMSPARLRETVGELSEMGLQGIEVFYAEHSSAQVDAYSKLAEDFGLIMTGGSDFHGALNKDVRLGVGFGPLRVADELLYALEDRRDHCRAEFCAVA